MTLVYFYCIGWVYLLSLNNFCWRACGSALFGTSNGSSAILWNAGTSNGSSTILPRAGTSNSSSAICKRRCLITQMITLLYIHMLQKLLSRDCMQNHTLRNYCGTTADGIHCRSAKKDYERQRKECGNSAERLRKCSRRTVTLRRCCGNGAERLREWCGHSADKMQSICSPVEDALLECTPGLHRRGEVSSEYVTRWAKTRHFPQIQVRGYFIHTGRFPAKLRLLHQGVTGACTVSYWSMKPRCGTIKTL